MPTENANLIYKYYAPNEYNLDALLNHYFWFSKRECLNDPFELDHITLGNINRSNSPYRNIILTIAQSFNVDVYEIDLSHTDFRLTKKLIQSKVNI